MPDPLHESIEVAIDQALDGPTFERCAVDILRKHHYPKLRGTPEKRDLGVDGICGSDSDPEFILVATTREDPARNLRESVESYVQSGGPGRTVVFATTREVTIALRRKLSQELLEDWDVTLRTVHDRVEFVRLLYD